MELRDAISALRTRWWLPIVVLLFAGGAALGVSLLTTPLYQSSTQLFVSANGSNSPAGQAQSDQVAQDRVASYAQLVAGPDLARRLVDNLGLPMTPEQLQKEMAVSAVPGTLLIKVTVTDPSPQQAFRIAQAVGAEFPVQAAQLETADATPSPVRVTVAEQPRVPDRPSSPQLVRNVGIAAVLGLLVGAVAALMRPVLDRTVRDPRQAAEVTSAPVIGVVPRSRALRRPAKQKRGGASREFRALRAMLQCLDVGESSVLTVASCLQAEGKTTVALNLGLALAEEGYAVTVVEADLSSPSMARYLGLPEEVGLAHVLAGLTDVDGAMRPHPRGELSVMPAGTMPAHLPEPLRGAQLFPILEKLRAGADVVLVDGPPLLTDPDAARIAAHTDGAILAVRYGRTRRTALREGLELLQFARARMLGVVLTMVPRRSATTTWLAYPVAESDGPGKHALPGQGLDSERGPDQW